MLHFISHWTAGWTSAPPSAFQANLGFLSNILKVTQILSIIARSSDTYSIHSLSTDKCLPAHLGGERLLPGQRTSLRFYHNQCALGCGLYAIARETQYSPRPCEEKQGEKVITAQDKSYRCVQLSNMPSFQAGGCWIKMHNLTNYCKQKANLLKSMTAH